MNMRCLQKSKVLNEGLGESGGYETYKNSLLMAIV